MCVMGNDNDLPACIHPGNFLMKINSTNSGIVIKFNELQNFLPCNFYGLRYPGKVLKLAETKLSLHPAGTDLYTIYDVS